MTLAEKFPPLYECSVCGQPVTVTPLGLGIEPRKEFKCKHVTATIYANRKVTLRGKGTLITPAMKLTLTVRQLLSTLLGRSV
jgi:hypothetical protein